MKEHIQQVSTRMCYARNVRVDDPYRLLAMAVILQAALDLIYFNDRYAYRDFLSADVLYVKNQRLFNEFLNAWDAYAEMCCLDITPEQYLDSVRKNIRKWSNGKIQRHATAYVFVQQVKTRKETEDGQQRD